MSFNFAPYGIYLQFTSVQDINAAGGGTTKTFSSFSGGVTDFNLIEAKLSLGRPDTSAPKATFLIEDSSGALGVGTVNRVTQVGSTFTCKIGKTANGTLVMVGIIDKRRTMRGVGGEMTYELTCYDYNSRLLQRVVNIHRYQNMLAGGTLDTADTKMDVVNLAKFALGFNKDGTANSDAYQPMAQDSAVKTVAVDDGFTVNNLTLTTHLLPTYDADFRPIADVLKDLGGQVNYTYYVGTDGNVNFVPLSGSSVDSGILISSDPNQSWYDKTKLGYIIDDDEPLYITDDITDTKNGIIGISGNNTTPNYLQTGVGGTAQDNHANFLAFKLPKLGDNRLSQVALWLDKVGNPTVDLYGEIRVDSSNAPTGALVKGFQIPRGDVPLSPASANWVSADFTTDLINPSDDHWLILWGGYTGLDASNYYRWYNDGTSASTNASGSGGPNSLGAPANGWTVNNGNSYAYAYLLFNQEKLVHTLYSPDSISAFKLREDVFRDDQIKTKDALIQIVLNIARLAKYPKRSVEAWCLPPNTNIQVGNTIHIYDAVSGLTDTTLNYKVTQLDYLFRNGIEQALQVKVTATLVNVN